MQEQLTKQKIVSITQKDTCADELTKFIKEGVAMKGAIDNDSLSSELEVLNTLVGYDDALP
eukprot:10556871-Lingulodinium_polyedra.AAC.1